MFKRWSGRRRDCQSLGIAIVPVYTSRSVTCVYLLLSTQVYLVRSRKYIHDICVLPHLILSDEQPKYQTPIELGIRILNSE